MAKLKKEKRNSGKEGILSKMKNWTISLVLAFGMLYGLQCYSASSLKFVQISDIHYYTGTNNTSFKLIAESSKLLDDAIDQINNIPNISFVMLTGDQIDKSFEKELNAFLPHMKELKYPWYFTFGNHDTCVGGYLTKEVYLDLVAKNNEHCNFKHSYYSFAPQKGYKVIVLDPIIRDRITANGQIDKTQLEWLDKEIQDAPKDVILIFMHVPIKEPFSSPNHRLLNANEVDEILHKHKNPIGVFTGHYHAGKILQNDNVLYISTPALVSYPNAFRLVNVMNYKNKVVFDVQLKETRLKNLQKLAKLMVFNSTIYTGEEKDQSAIYVINRKK